MQLRRFWNGKVLGLPKATLMVLGSLLLFVVDRIATLFWKYNLGYLGRGTVIQSHVSIRYPGNVEISSRVNIGRHVVLMSEFADSYLHIGERSSVDKKVVLDFSGGLVLGENVVISEGASVYTHSHGLKPKSTPVMKPLVVQDDVWIGSHAIILEGVNVVGKGSVVAAGAVVTKDVPSYTLVAGVPAQVIGTIND